MYTNPDVEMVQKNAHSINAVNRYRCLVKRENLAMGGKVVLFSRCRSHSRKATSRQIDKTNTTGTSTHQPSIWKGQFSGDLQGSLHPFSTTPDWVKLNMNKLNPLVTRNPPIQSIFGTLLPVRARRSHGIAKYPRINGIAPRPARTKKR